MIRIGAVNLLVAAIIPLLLFLAQARAAEAVRFSRDILPLLSENCFSCHGPDESHRKGKLRLDTREGALGVGGGPVAIQPGDPGRSELVKRIFSTDPDLVMPPPESRKKLTAAQVDMLKRWITQGAPWGRHWAFESPTRPEVPTGRKPGKGVHPVDAFIRSRLVEAGLSPSPEASRRTLLRRVSFDLTGLPPTREEMESFLADRKPGAWERVVHRLLASEHFGERMAMWWLDAARYSDTDGYQADDTRTNWPWRDWVVGAFNRNLPFDQFTREQFAGDLLPGATDEQRLATSFHRNHMTNGEGGRDPEESRVDYVIDRVNTVGTVWLGLTLGCTQCHSHKFDPVSQADYYKLTAFFNSIDEDGKAGRGAKPNMAYQSPHAGRAVTEARELVTRREPVERRVREEAEPAFRRWLDARIKDTRAGFSGWSTLRGSLESSEGTLLNQESDGVVQASGPNPNQDDYRLHAAVRLERVTGIRLEVFPHSGHSRGAFSRGRSGEFILTDIKVQVTRRGSSQIRDIQVSGAVADFGADKKKNDNYGDVRDTLDDDPRNGWTTIGAETIRPHTAVFELAAPLVLEPDEQLLFEMRHRSTLGDANTGRFRVSVTDQPGGAVRSTGLMPLERLGELKVKEDSAERIPEPLMGELREQFLLDHAPYVEARASLDRARRQLDEVVKAAGKLDVMVLAERKEPRATHVLVRGVWDKHGDRVERGVPEAVAPWPQGLERSRLGLAEWIVSRENPLTARVVANHLWQLCFGAGLVRTPEDFGLQGERPTHPQLLDWLAVELMESGWDVKKLIRLLVTSETYRQSSDVNAELLERDPENRLLARGSRFRLPSWMIRDAAIHHAGLLNRAIGGPPVKPYQPSGLWEEIFMGRFKYEPSEGAAQHRRTLYAFWRRSIAPAFLFDSAQRRVCEVRTPRTNTPLQALTLLNDETYLESARVMASRSITVARTDPQRIRLIFETVTGREPDRRELTVLRRELDRARAHYQRHSDAAGQMLDPGQAEVPSGQDAAEIAALSVVAGMVLNLDESITHE